MTRKSKFYDIVPKEDRSIRNIPIPEKRAEGDDLINDSSINHPLHRSSEKTNNNSIKKKDHKESSSVEIKKLDRPITNVEEYDEDEYIEIIDHKISDDEITEEVHILGENKEEIENNKIPALAETEDDNFTAYTKNTKNKNGLIGGFLKGPYKIPLLIFIVVILLFILLNVFSTTTITIKTKDLQAKLDSGYKFDKGDGEIIQATTSISVHFPANGTVRIDKKSVGSVVIFNNTSASQKLSSGTRIQSSNGLVYTLDRAVVVPAKKTVSKKSVPGSVTTTFSASEVGDKYNSGPKDFVLPGFKGTAKYDTIYGRSKGNITGGYSGEVPNISQKDLGAQVTQAGDALKSTLTDLIKKQANTIGLIIDTDTLQYKIVNSEPKMSADGKNATVNINGTVQGATLLNASLGDASKSILGINDTNGLNYVVNLSSSTVDISNASSSDGQITAEGNIDLSLSINKDELAKSLENKDKKTALALIQQTKGVVYAQIKVFPFWKTTLSKASRINILVQD